MAKIPLTIGDYQTRNVIAEAQSTINLYGEKNPEDAEQPFTYYPTPGLTTVATATPFTGSPISGWRCLYFATNNQMFGVCGKTVYYIDDSFGLHVLGSVVSTGSQISMVDNRTTLVIVDGTSAGYTIVLATHAFAAIGDPNFLGGDRIWYLDTFMVSNVHGTNQFQSTLSNATVWDPLYVATKTGFSDDLQAIAVLHREIWLIGYQTTEVWYNSGAATFPFEILPGIFLEQGCIAKHSIATYDLMVFWLNQNRQGRAQVMMGQAYKAQRISTYAMEAEISAYPTLADSIAFTYEQDGHVFYVIQFPQADKTWVYDVTNGQWHQRVHTVASVNHKWPIACCTFWPTLQLIVGGDFDTGKLYRIDLDVFTDDGQAILRQKSYPHLVNDGKRVNYAYFSADMGIGPIGASNTVNIQLDWSDDRGATYGTQVTQTVASGTTSAEFLAQPKWNRTGMARDRVFRLSWTFPYKHALNGAYIEAVPYGT